MALIETTGNVGFIKVNGTRDSNFAFFEVLDASTTPPTSEFFFLWFMPAIPSVPTGPEWLLRAMQVSLLRDAVSANKTVSVFHDETSSLITSLQLNA
jgi:hypothetical protein